MADQHTPSKAEAKNAEKEADQVVAAFSQALDIAFEAEVEYIVGELHQNRALTHCLSGMLKADTLQALLDGRLREGQLATSSGAQPDANARGPGITKLRSASSRFEHLKTQPTVVLRLLRKILPEHFPAGTRPSISMLSRFDVLLFPFFIIKQSEYDDVRRLGKR